MATLIIAIVISASIFNFLCRYHSNGFLRIPLDNVHFNTWKSSFTDRNHLQRFLTASGSMKNIASTSLLSSMQTNILGGHVVPVYPYTKEDLQNSGDKNIPRGILGFSISFDAKSPDEAQAKVALMGDFIKDTALRQDLADAVQEGAIRAATASQQLDNDMIAKRFTLEQDMRKLEDLTALKAQYPDAAKMETRQLVSTSADGAYRYLSPVAQLIGVSSQITDLKSDIADLERRIAQNKLAAQYYGEAIKLTEKRGSGKDLLANLLKLKERIFAGRDVQNDETRQVLNDITLTIDDINARDSLRASFVSGPNLPTRRSGPGLITLAIMSLFLGALVAVVGILVFDHIKSIAGNKNAGLNGPQAATVA